MYELLRLQIALSNSQKTSDHELGWDSQNHTDRNSSDDNNPTTTNITASPADIPLYI